MNALAREVEGLEVALPEERKRMTPKPAVSAAVLAMALSVIGCGDDDDDDDTTGGEAVGEACTPEMIPEGGFQQTEVYLESDTIDCPNPGCVVNHLVGDPTETDPGEPDYVSPAEIERRVYCTCKCAAEASETIDCPACPDGFECCPLFTIGAADLAGSYCVRAGTCVDAGG